MKSSLLWVSLATLALAGSFSGCSCTVESSPPAETVYESEPPPPPPPQQEVLPPPPGPEFVWIGGYHRWNGRAYVWVPGRYNRRPHAAARWEAAHWEGRGRAHVWVEGRWR
jgi:WXXGXW repeat (2 copies)